MTSLFDPIRLRGLDLANRLWAPPMCQYSAGPDGVPTDWHLVHLGGLAAGGAGLVIAEAAGVSPEGRISPADVGLWSAEQVTAWRRITAFVHGQGGAIAVQLSHAGRKGSTQPPHLGRDSVAAEDGGWTTVAPSNLAFGRYAAPDALDEAGIRSVIDDFAAAARNAVGAGFDAVEVHAAHGYLLHQFLSPLSNHRQDGWGGSFEARTRLVLEVFDAVRAAVPETMPVLVRLSATDWVEGGWDLPQTVRLATLLEQRGVDLLDVSTGGLDPAQAIELGAGYQVPFAHAVREAVSIPVAAVGLIDEPAQAQAVLDEGSADVVLMGRQLLREPSFPRRAAGELGAEVAWPVQYLRARR